MKVCGLQKYALTAVSTAVVALVCRHVHLKYLVSGRRSTHSPMLASEITWLDQGAYEALIAICDALLPSLSVQSTTDEELLKILRKMGIANAPDTLRASLSSLRAFKGFLCAGAVDNGTHRHAAQAVQSLLCRKEQEQLYAVLKAMSTSMGNFVLTGYVVPFKDLSLECREAALMSLQTSHFETFRALFHVFKRLIGSLYLSFVEKGTNPNWSAMDYNIPSHPLPPLREDSDEAILKRMISYDYVYPHLLAHAQERAAPHPPTGLTVDAIIIGSGCGGGVMAHTLTLQGYTVLVIEKGGYYNARDFAQWGEAEAMSRCLEKGGLCSTSDSNMLVLAGSCVGGGSTINWSASFETPEYVLKEWGDMGLQCFSDGTYHRSMEYIHGLMGVNTNNSYYDEKEECSATPPSFRVNENNRFLWQGAVKSGYTPEKIPRNVKGCVDCGHCCFGCRHGSKQSTITALLEPLLLRQYRDPSVKGKLYVIPNCVANKVCMVQNSKGQYVATGVQATASIVQDKGGSNRHVVRSHDLTVHAKIVVSSAGALHTPVLLIKSGLKDPHIGSHLCLHPVVGAGGLHSKDKDTGLSKGVSMGVVVRNPKICANGDTAHPIAVQTPPVHSGLFGVIVPWISGLSYKIGALCWKNMSVFICISRDYSHPSNRVDVDSNGDLVVHYRVQEKDKKSMLAGLGMVLQFVYASGAQAIFPAHALMPWFVRPEAGGEVEGHEGGDDAAFAAYKTMVMQDPLEPLNMLICTAHQMSSCRMSSSSDTGAVAPSGELYSCKNLFVADASVLPTALGINPMITIESVAHMLSRHVLDRLSQMN